MFDMFSDYIRAAEFDRRSDRGLARGNGRDAVEQWEPQRWVRPPQLQSERVRYRRELLVPVQSRRSACGNIVFDFRNRLDVDQPDASLTFAGPGIGIGGQVLTGSIWTVEEIVPGGGSVYTNQRYYLELSAVVDTGSEAVPEPMSMALLGGAVLGLGAVRRRK